MSGRAGDGRLRAHLLHPDRRDGGSLATYHPAPQAGVGAGERELASAAVEKALSAPLRGRLPRQARGRGGEDRGVTVLGVDEDAQKEMLCTEKGIGRAQPWAEVLRSLQSRGHDRGAADHHRDGALGIWSAMDDVFPTAAHGRRWNHRAVNLIGRLPKCSRGSFATNSETPPRRSLDPSASSCATSSALTGAPSAKARQSSA